ncbi:MAG: hypothetical protein AAGG44_19890 [Planctomycetota bacterium]
MEFNRIVVFEKTGIDGFGVDDVCTLAVGRDADRNTCTFSTLVAAVVTSTNCIIFSPNTPRERSAGENA